MRRAALAAVVPLAIGGLVAVAPAAHADHVHFRVTGSGSCVLLAPDGNEKYVQLPTADAYPENRRHPLHTQVHLGRPGEVGPIYVAYTHDGTLTADALQRCPDGFVNR